MLGFVAVLASALLGVVLIFITMLVSFFQAMLAPTDGDYKLENQGGLLFPIDSFLLSEDIISATVETYMERKGDDHDITIGTTCSFGERLDRFTAERYTAYNYVFLRKFEMEEEFLRLIKATTPEENTMTSRCYLLITEYSPDDEKSGEIKFIRTKDEE
ncbi:hypothetical protein VCHA53O466_40147 [Vibrio chagasii]|nr:hypothetical protein VCHA53O466_40147 [Vibrio chagasii]